MTAKGATALVDAAASGKISRSMLTKHTLAPTLTGWPFRRDNALDHHPRTDMRVSSATGTIASGFPLALTLTVSELDGDGNIAPLAGAYVDLWHADADGRYAGVESADQDVLRGYQTTDECGEARFVSVFPGWNDFGAEHIQVRVRAIRGGRSVYDLTTRLVFDGNTTDKIHTVISQFFPTGLNDTGAEIDESLNGQPGQAVLDEIAGGTGDRYLLKIADGAIYLAADIHLVIAAGASLAAINCLADVDS